MTIASFYRQFITQSYIIYVVHKKHIIICSISHPGICSNNLTFNIRSWYNLVYFCVPFWYSHCHKIRATCRVKRQLGFCTVCVFFYRIREFNKSFGKLLSTTAQQSGPINIYIIWLRLWCGLSMPSYCLFFIRLNIYDWQSHKDSCMTCHMWEYECI